MTTLLHSPIVVPWIPLREIRWPVRIICLRPGRGNPAPIADNVAGENGSVKLLRSDRGRLNANQFSDCQLWRAMLQLGDTIFRRNDQEVTSTDDQLQTQRFELK